MLRWIHYDGKQFSLKIPDNFPENVCAETLNITNKIIGREKVRLKENGRKHEKEEKHKMT